MSRQQRRIDRKSQSRTPAPVSRRTPVRAAGGRQIPWVPIVIAGGVIAVVGLLAYLVVQSQNSGPDVNKAQRAADDASSSIPGTFVPNPEGVQRPHLPKYVAGQTPIPFCPDVPRSADADAASGITPAATTSAAATATPPAEAT